jgi:hypothetical protein
MPGRKSIHSVSAGERLIEALEQAEAEDLLIGQHR